MLFVPRWGSSMNRWPLFAGCLLSACALQPGQPLSPPMPVIAEAQARNCDEALRQAKTNAADNVAGTFVHGQRSLINDKQYSENINEYTSGVVRRFNVIEKSGSSPCRVKIEAWVEPGNVKVELTGAPQSIGVEEINRRALQLKNNQNFLVKHFRNTQGFKIRFGQQETFNEQPNSIGIALDVVAVQPPRGWLEDLEAFISIHATPVVYEPVSRARALSRLLTFTREGESSSPGPWAFEICFEHRVHDQIRCYTGEHNRKIIRVLRSPILDISLQTSSGEQQVVTQNPTKFTYYAHKPMKVRYRAAGYEPRSDFPMVTFAPLPARVGFDYPSRQLPASASILGKLRFSDVNNQYPLEGMTP